jgi:phosphoribosyl 1,2-cyclic phosphodiesterase
MLANESRTTFHLTVLGSGSSGNCSLVETPTTRILIDAGFSTRRITQRLAEIGVQPEQIDGILVTHEHSDHSYGLNVWSKRFKTPIYANRLTAEALSKSVTNAAWKIFATGSAFPIGDLEVDSFSIPHDAAEPVGYVLRHASREIGFLTDLGFATRMVTERVRAVHTLVIETNHDEKMLQNDTRRPWAVKQRIMSRHGHLSNTAAAELLAEMVGGNLRRAVLGHLSEDCNTPELAISTVRNRLALSGGESVEVLCATSPQAAARMAVH